MVFRLKILILSTLFSFSGFAKVVCHINPNESGLFELALEQIEKNFEIFYDVQGLKYFKIEYQKRCSNSYSNELRDRISHLESKYQNRKKSCTNIKNISPVIKESRNQGDIGWCYAHTAADLVSYKINKKVSAAYMAINYNEKSMYHLFNRHLSNEFASQEGGLAYDLLTDFLESLKLGVCLEKDAPSSDFDGDEIQDVVHTVEEIYDEFQVLRGSFNHFSYDNEPLFTSRAKAKETIRSFYKSKEFKHFVKDTYKNDFKDSIIETAFPNVDFYEFINILSKSSRNTLYPNLVKKTCEGKKRYLKKKAKIKHIRAHFDKDKIISKIDSVLSKKNILEFGYYGSVLFNPFTKRSGNHSSLLVGRRFNEEVGQCEYLIQNTWGVNCTLLAREHTCEDGRIWIKEKHLRKAIYTITWIE